MKEENFRILVVDDEQSFALLISRILKDEGYRVESSPAPSDALARIDEACPDLVISDLRMPGMNGIDFMASVRAKHPETDFIMVTAFASVETAVSAMKLGAADYITKPLRDPDELREVVRKAFENQKLVAENRALRDEIGGGLPPLPLIFAGMEKVREEIEAVAPLDTTIMLYGETGTGKSLIAKVIHQLSGKKGFLVTINCAAIPENLLESELFGYEKGAFTGANRTKKGKFEFADEGTIFLDEIAETSPPLQAKLLRVLQEKSFERLGGLETIRTDARIVAATNRDLKQLVSERRFREDLYYRINVFPVHIPPLRERQESIPELAENLGRKFSLKVGKRIDGISPQSVGRLKSYHWPGNIRELENVIEKAIILSRDGTLSIPELRESSEEPLSGDMKQIEKKAIENALRITGGNRKAAADVLGISLRSLQYKIKDYGITI